MSTWEVSVPPPRLTKMPPPLVPRPGTYTTEPSARAGEGNADPE